MKIQFEMQNDSIYWGLECPVLGTYLLSLQQRQ
jgi:hypothetical protein